jgi:hypothetical protein
MPNDIATQLAAAVEGFHAPADLAARVMRRSRSLRRRRLAGVSLLATAAIVVAVVVPLATSTRSSGISRLVPATSPPTTSPAPAAPTSNPATNSMSAGNVADAVIQIQATFHYAYTGTEPAAVKLGAIENGAKLAPVLSEISRQLPDDTVRTTKITTGRVTFLDPNHALVDYTLTYDYQGGPVSQTGQAKAVVVDGAAWRVSESSYCDSVQRFGVTLTCPPK